LEDAAGNFAAAIHWLTVARDVSPAPDALQKQIDEIQKKIAARP
jgi:hypothetical protein